MVHEPVVLLVAELFHNVEEDPHTAHDIVKVRCSESISGSISRLPHVNSL